MAAGATVRVLARPRGDRRALEGVRVEFVEGDLLDPVSVRRAVAGVQTVYHVAADYRLWAPDPAVIYRTNVDGTRAVLEAAGDAGVARVVHTSSVGALGIPNDGTPGTEDTPVTLDKMVGHYKRSKFLGEAAGAGLRPPRRAGGGGESLGAGGAVGHQAHAHRTDDRGLHARTDGGDASTPASTWSTCGTSRRATCWRPSAASRVRSTSSATRPATSRSPASSRCSPTSRAAARRASACRTPWRGAAPSCCEGVARITGRPPAVPLTAVRMARKRMYFSPAKAIRDLGLPQTDPTVALRDAVAWFAAHGYAPAHA